MGHRQSCIRRKKPGSPGFFYDLIVGMICVQYRNIGCSGDGDKKPSYGSIQLASKYVFSTIGRNLIAVSRYLF
jgi:hypothetical protein